MLSSACILQGNALIAENVREGDTIEPRFLDDLALATVRSAMTVGPSVIHFSSNDDHDINHDRSLGDRPPFGNRRMARSVVYQTKDRTTYIEMFDGAPRTALFQGITPREVASLVYNGREIAWAYHLDPGQSSRIVVRHTDGAIIGYGNRHYVRWPKIPGHPLVWSGEHGRAVPSALVIKKK